MPAYVILLRERTKDKAELATYARKAKAVAKRDYKIVAMYGKIEVLEGDPLEAVGILEFESFEAAQEWYANPEYRDALAHRLNGGDYRTVIVEGRDA